MRKLRIVVAVLLVGILSVICWQVLRPRVPAYQGKTLKIWLEESLLAYNYTTPPTEESMAAREEVGTAIRQIGTNAIPLLVKMATDKASPLKSRLIMIARRQRWVATHLHTDHENQEMAVFGFYALGSLAKDAVPALIDLLGDSDVETRLHAADGLGNIGPTAKAAVPYLIPFLNDTNRIVRWDTTVNLGRIHSESTLVVPALLKSLNRSNVILTTTITVLGEFGGEATSAVPFLVQHLNAENDYVRLEATNALKRIDPGAAAKAGVK